MGGSQSRVCAGSESNAVQMRGSEWRRSGGVSGGVIRVEGSGGIWRFDQSGGMG